MGDRFMRYLASELEIGPIGMRFYLNVKLQCSDVARSSPGGPK